MTLQPGIGSWQAGIVQSRLPDAVAVDAYCPEDTLEPDTNMSRYGNVMTCIAGTDFVRAIAPLKLRVGAVIKRLAMVQGTEPTSTPFKDKLPKGAWREILVEGLGDENAWTDVNGAFTARKGNVTG